VYGVAFSPRGDLIATASWDQTARIWDAATGACLATLAGHAGTVEAVAFSPSGTLLATGSGDATARVWDAATGAHLVTLAGHDYTVRAVAFSPSGALLATASSDATARLWDAASGAHLATLVPLPSGGYLTLLPDARYKLDGDPGDCLWWAAGLCRLTPAEVSSRFPEVRRLPPGTPILPA
jgi:WD40 repeat protein